MSEQQIKDLILAIDLLIAERINNPNDTYEQFTARRDRIIKQALTVMKIKRSEDE